MRSFGGGSDGVINADESEAAYAVGLVTLAGTTSVIVLPAMGRLAGIDDVLFGRWTGAAVQDVAQVIAAASAVGTAAVATATVVKLTRVLLAPLAAIIY